MQQRVADTNDKSSPADAAGQTRFRTFAGTISRGMEVIAGDGSHLGEVDKVEGDHIVLVPASSAEKKDEYFVPLSLIDGIDDNQVLLAVRGDASFGLGAEP